MTSPDAVIAALRERGETVAVAESLTGGLVCGALTEVPGASLAVRGGIVSYATDLKADLLGVDADLLAAGGPVQAEVAAQMAAGVAGACGADWGVATTGVAGPGPADGHPAGTVYVAVAGPGVRQARQVAGLVERGAAGASRAEIRAATVAGALDLLGQVVPRRA